MISKLRPPSFIAVAGVMLALTGLAKAFSAIGPSRVLDVADPVFGVPFRGLMLLVGFTELLIAFFCLFTKQRTFCVCAVAWLSTSFMIYRLGLSFMDWHRPCKCLGNVTDLLHISPQIADNIMKTVLAFLLLGSYGAILQLWRRRQLLLRLAP